jgi:hypothetical protein
MRPRPVIDSRPDALVDAAPRGRRNLRPLANALAGTALIFEALAIVLLLAAPNPGVGFLDSSSVGGFVLGATFPIVGWLIASRRPGNAIGWIFIGVGLSQALDSFAQRYAVMGLVVAPGSLPAADVMAWVGTWVWAPGFTLLLTATVLLFPDGRPPSPRWRPVLWLAAAACVLMMVSVAIAGWSSRGVALLAEGQITSTDPVLSTLLTLEDIGLVLLMVASVASIAGLVVRFRRSRGVERLQLKWFVAAGIVEIAMLVFGTLVTLPWPTVQVLGAAVASPLVPLAATIAILRYRLFDIDRIISRTVSYAAVTGLLALVFVGLVLGLQWLLKPLTAANGLAVAASTLVVAVVFQPLRSRVQRLVDRRFDRARYDSETVVARFVDRLRDQTDLDTILTTVIAGVDSALQPADAGLWVRERRGRS